MFLTICLKRTPISVLNISFEVTFTTSVKKSHFVNNFYIMFFHFVTDICNSGNNIYKCSWNEQY